MLTYSAETKVPQETQPSLGLRDQTYETDADFDPKHVMSQWQRFEHYVRNLKQREPKVQYRVLYVARHGQGVHNVKEAQVGRHEWEVLPSLRRES